MSRNYVQAVAQAIQRVRDFDWTYTFADAQRTNDGEGWTLEFAAPLGNTLRVKGVHLSQSELQTAWERAETWLEGVR